MKIYYLACRSGVEHTDIVGLYESPESAAKALNMTLDEFDFKRFSAAFVERGTEDSIAWREIYVLVLNEDKQ